MDFCSGYAAWTRLDRAHLQGVAGDTGHLCSSKGAIENSISRDSPRKLEASWVPPEVSHEPVKITKLPTKRTVSLGHRLWDALAMLDEC